MKVPAERTSALIQTRQFLQNLLTIPRVPRAVREEAKALLRHYPCVADIEIAHNARPDWFGLVLCSPLLVWQSMAALICHCRASDCFTKEKSR